MARRRLGFWRRLAWAVVKPPMLVLTRRDWRGAEHLAGDGGMILVPNHISYADPLVAAHFVYDAGRWPQFLAKAELFRMPVLGRFLYRVRQIPVERGTAEASKSLAAAIAAIKAGDAIIIYPEGTITRHPDLWPMRGKIGVARLWLATKAPVVPIAMWGPQRIFDTRTRRLRLRPRTPVSVVAGPPVDLSAFEGADADAATLAAITEVVMQRVADLLGEIRGQSPPPLWSPTQRAEEVR